MEKAAFEHLHKLFLNIGTHVVVNEDYEEYVVKMGDWMCPPEDWNEMPEPYVHAANRLAR